MGLYHRAAVSSAGSRKGSFSFHLLLPLDVGSNKRKGLNFQARKQNKGIFRAQDTKVTEDAVTPNLKSSTIAERTL